MLWAALLVAVASLTEAPWIKPFAEWCERTDLNRCGTLDAQSVIKKSAVEVRVQPDRALLTCRDTHDGVAWVEHPTFTMTKKKGKWSLHAPHADCSAK